MNRILKSTLALMATGLIGSALIAPDAQAQAPITGSITFSGGVQLRGPGGTPTNTAGNATGVITWLNEAGQQPTVASTSGSFDSVAIGTTATFTNNYNFNMVGPFLLWQVGGFSFTLSQSNIVFQGPGFVTVQGFGTLTGAGFAPTAGIWRFTSQDPAAGTPPTFSFSASTQAIVPEGGATVALLGLGLVGLEGLRRKLRKTAK
jgi:hypothetical protein